MPRRRRGAALPAEAAPARPERETVFHPEFREDLRFWVETDRRLVLRAFDLIEALVRDPLHGIGEPAHLRVLALHVRATLGNGGRQWSMSLHSIPLSYWATFHPNTWAILRPHDGT